MNLTLEAAIAAFGAKAKTKLDNPAATGQPEDQIRAPFEGLLGQIAELCGFPQASVAAIGESAVADLKTRPLSAVSTTAPAAIEAGRPSARRATPMYAAAPSESASGSSA